MNYRLQGYECDQGTIKIQDIKISHDDTSVVLQYHQSPLNQETNGLCDAKQYTACMMPFPYLVAQTVLVEQIQSPKE